MPAVSVNQTSLGAAHTSFASPNSRRETVPDLVKVCPTCGVRYPAEFMVCPRDASELNEVDAPEDEDELVGQTIAQSYTIVRVLGEGGMGRVYEARHTRIKGKRFAIKMLHPEYARQPEVLTRFQREAEAAATIHSANVVDVYDVDRTADGRPFLVAEFLEGKEFATYLEEVGKMPVGAAVRIVRQICKALQAAHDKGVVHRDMKPENVFLTGDPAQPLAKVIDFGISKVGDTPGTALTKTGMIMGTPSYMAPEQARGERVDHRADIYAVGAILYCALTGQRPFDRGDPTATLTAVLTQDPPRPRSLEASIPEPLEMIIQKAMSKRPEDRYPSMAELDADLAAYEPGEATTLMSLTPTTGGIRSTGSEFVRSASLDKQVRTVALARPMILLLSVLGTFWAAGSLVLAITGIIRLARGGGAKANLEVVDAILLSFGVLFTALTPVILAGRHLAKNVWGNSMKAVELAEKLRRPVVVGLSAYGFATLLVRLLESVLLRHAVGVAWPWWDVVLFAIGGIAAGGTYVLTMLEKPKTA
ncbi:serine/threonine protein kinase [Minicystis rosea]|nr:serine/threonine protein kinase [Minicystis rosea]